ncbi:hypothetical protein S40288_11153 [Stachybotrys chartarum IBT 40288]|nr:hypothetical protein S40288_11153 [Stachybotrys chartarum IBT 40288]
MAPDSMEVRNTGKANGRGGKRCGERALGGIHVATSSSSRCPTLTTIIHRIAIATASSFFPPRHVAMPASCLLNRPRRHLSTAVDSSQTGCANARLRWTTRAVHPANESPWPRLTTHSAPPGINVFGPQGRASGRIPARVHIRPFQLFSSPRVLGLWLHPRLHVHRVDEPRTSMADHAPRILTRLEARHWSDLHALALTRHRNVVQPPYTHAPSSHPPSPSTLRRAPHRATVYRGRMHHPHNTPRTPSKRQSPSLLT